jgi:hypothetical protein
MSRALRGLGGLVVVLAVLPWLGAGAAQASGGGDGSCSTRPPGVSATATCTLLLGPNGTKVFGETWVDRTAANHLVVDTFPTQPVEGPDGVTLCARASGPYPAKHTCSTFDSDIVFSGDSTSIDVTLSAFGITSDSPVFFALNVQQASSTAWSVGSGGTTPTASPSGSPSTSPSTSHSPSHSPSSSPSVSGTSTSTSSPSHHPSSSAGATEETATPSTSVLAVTLAHTGGGGVGQTLVLSLALLALGGLMIIAGQRVPATARRRH